MTEVDWSQKGVEKRLLTFIQQICPRRRAIKQAVQTKLWSKIMTAMRKLPKEVGKQLLTRFFSPLPHGEEVGNFIADLLYEIPWLKPQGDPSQLKAKLIELGREFQIRLQLFGLKKPVPVQIIEKDWVVARAAARDVAGVAALEAAWDAALEAARDVAGVAAGDAALAAAGATALAAALAAAGATAGDAAGDAALDAAGVAAWLIGQDRRPLQGKKSPFKILMEIWALGAWPIGFVGDGEKTTFTIFLPHVRQAQ